MVARFGAAEEARLPLANGWLQHAAAAASWAIWVVVGAATKPANGWGHWGQGVAAGGGGADELDPDVGAAGGGVDVGGGDVGGVGGIRLTCQRLAGPVGKEAS